jgi:hypothetical protein
VDVGDLDVRQALHAAEAELAVDRVAPVRRAIILDLVGIDVSEQAKVARAERVEVVGVGLWSRRAQR